MNHVLPHDAATDRRPLVGTNSAIEQSFAPMAAPYRPPRPNQLIVDVCDLGLAEIGAYGGAHAETPNIDRLARSGVRFTDAHTTVDDPLAGPEVTNVLSRNGYTTEPFGASGRADLDVDTEAAIEFIGRRRAIPWAMYARLHARPAPMEPLPSMLTYSHAVARVDAAVGRLIAALRRTEQYRSTFVLLVGASESERLVYDRAHRPDGAHGRRPRTRVPTVASWPGRLPARQRHDDAVLTVDWMPTLLSLACAADRSAATGSVDLSGHLLDGGAVPARELQVRAA